MHFGQIFGEILQNTGITTADLAAGMDRPEAEIQQMISKPDWTTLEVREMSNAIDYDLGKFASSSEVLPEGPDQSGFSLYLKYPKADRKRLYEFLDRIKPIAQEYGIELD